MIIGLRVTEYALGSRSGTVPPRATGLHGPTDRQLGVLPGHTDRLLGRTSGRAVPAARAECLLALDAVYVPRQRPGRIGLPTELYMRLHDIMHVEIKESESTA